MGLGLQGVWQFIVGAIFFLAAVAAIVVAIPITNAGVRKFFGRVNAWWHTRRRLESAVDTVIHEVVALQVAVKELTERQGLLEGYFAQMRDRSRETFRAVEDDYRNLRDITNDHELRLDQMKPLEDFVVATRPALDDLQTTSLKLQAAQVRGETEQQRALEKLRADLTKLQERFDKLAGQFSPRP